MQKTTERPSFLWLRREYGLTSEQVAQEAKLPLADEYQAEIGCEVTPDIAERVRAAFSRLTRKTWTMQETAIILRKDVTV